MWGFKMYERFKNMDLRSLRIEKRKLEDVMSHTHKEKERWELILSHLENQWDVMQEIYNAKKDEQGEFKEGDPPRTCTVGVKAEIINKQEDNGRPPGM